jgi:flagellar basal-body rod protein FlgF
MDNGLYVALSKQTAQFREMNIIANNMANATTAGFKKNEIVFSAYLSNEGHRSKIAYAQDLGEFQDFSSGSFQYTGNSLDMAIEGDGFFVVETPLGPRYTRAGNFRINAENTLVNPQGHPVLGAGGQQIQFQQEDRDIAVGADGSIIVDGEERGALDIVQFEDNQKLQTASGTLFKSDETPQPATDVKVSQGVIETSNVEPISEISRMIMVLRRVSNTSQYIETSYDLQRKAQETLARQS